MGKNLHDYLSKQERYSIQYISKYIKTFLFRLGFVISDELLLPVPALVLWVAIMDEHVMYPRMRMRIYIYNCGRGQ